MSDAFLIALIFSLGFGIQSIFGFAGNTLSLAILVFFFDVKDMIVLKLFVSIAASLFIFLSDHKSYSHKIFKEILLFAIPGMILGTFFFKMFDSSLVLTIFSVFLIVYAIWMIFQPHVKVPEIFKPPVNFLSGVLGGMFGTLGPFSVAAMREKFKNKSEMRTTIAVLFLTLNLIRVPLYAAHGVLDVEKLIPFWWIIFPLFFAIWLGHRVHLRLSEKNFQTGVAILLLVAGISFLM